MTHRIALSFEDGVTRFVTCAPEQTVADASYRQRINIPLDCRDGACGTCKAFCESGEYEGGDYLDDALSPDEAARGYVLPCSMKPKSDLVLQIASTSAVAKTQAAEFRGTLTGLERLSRTTMALTVEIRDQIPFLPGQYVNVTVPGTEVTRSYSFSNAPGDGQLTFLVKLTPGGVMSDYLTGRAKSGDELTFTGPHGSFFLRETDRPVLLLAGGTGLAPMLSMVRTMSDDRPVHLVYGVSTDEDLVETATLEKLATDLPGFTWDYCVSDPASAAPNKGYVTTLIRDEHLHGGDVAVYLCGPPPMVEAVRGHFASTGFEPTGFYYEKFALAAAPVREIPVEEIELVPTGGRSLAGQELFPEAEVVPLRAGTALSAVDEALVARRIAGQEMLPAAEPPGEYEIGEEHPSVHESDAVFEARQALELGALELTIGRLSSGQLAGYRLLAESTVPYVDGDRFLDAAAYTETNAAFHDYLFTLTGNEHLLQAYQALGVKGHMAETLRNATWCHPRCTQDHLDLVAAFEAGDRATARRLIVEHADRSKVTTRRAMGEVSGPKFLSPGRFAGKVVVVTGAAQGIGEATARRIAAEGGSLVLADRSGLVSGLAGELPEALPVIADLETWAGAQAVTEAALTRFGRIDVLVNNVGGALRFKPFTEFSPDEIEAEVRRSLMTTLFSCRAAVASMAQRGGGVIVNVSSAATRGIHRIPYSAAKGGINALTASLAFEYAGAGIRVVATAPGGTEAPPRRIPRGGPDPATGQEQAWFQAHIDQTVESSLLKRYGTLDEQAAAIAFLASDEASYVTGTVLPVAGGDLG
ncbi:benzoate 1,2-dioxygenase electron transfer component BenC [Amycolatopsis jejuensis]|uniref:benzoate 1,2-dioxygenase electron transfer component BenC n=1 Tax=Amycolatopsis jejuensis TaxID=330084 RepID=UPI0005273669|nr:benzoate 1,2-dioxygenase electron transfer component BenC [Amycolatopsis jejuensis]